ATIGERHAVMGVGEPLAAVETFALEGDELRLRINSWDRLILRDNLQSDAWEMEPEAYLRALNIQFTYLFSFARKINEIDTAASVFGEFRGAQGAGWNTVDTAHEVYQELKTLGSKGAPLTRAELRQVLCLYAQLAEAGGVYEGLLNVMQVAK